MRHIWMGQKDGHRWECNKALMESIALRMTLILVSQIDHFL